MNNKSKFLFFLNKNEFIIVGLITQLIAYSFSFWFINYSNWSPESYVVLTLCIVLTMGFIANWHK